MRPAFADTTMTEAGIDLPDCSPDQTPARSAAYEEWRRTRVLFLRSLDDVKRPAASAGDDLPAQRTGADL